LPPRYEAIVSDLERRRIIDILPDTGGDSVGVADRTSFDRRHGWNGGAGHKQAAAMRP
jgi:hypothetical protein